MITNRDAIALFINSVFSGIVHDFQVLKDTFDELDIFLQRNQRENVGILADKGYQWIDKLNISSKTPHKIRYF